MLATCRLSLSASFCRNDIVFCRVLLNYGFGGTIIRELIWLHEVFELFPRDVSRRRKDSTFLHKYRSSFITAGLFIFGYTYLYVYHSHNYTRADCLPFYFLRLIHGHVIYPKRSFCRFTVFFSAYARKLRRCRKVETESMYWKAEPRKIGKNYLHFERIM